MSNNTHPPVPQGVPFGDAEIGKGWEWLNGAPRLRRLEVTFPLRCYLNLARREDRRAEAECQFARQGLTVERVPAANGRLARNVRGYASAGAYGCALSHRLLMRRAVQERAGAVLVFEDDVILDPDFRRLAEALPLPEDWGILYFGCQHIAPPVPVSAGVLRVTRANCTHAYAVRGIHAPRVREMMAQRKTAGPRQPCDVQLAYLADEVPTYAVWPNLAWQATAMSDISGGIRTIYREDGSQIGGGNHVSGVARAMRQFAAQAAQSLRKAGDGMRSAAIVEKGGAE